ncbi:MAG TPA: bacillithiol biosynthesis BshC, partial [Candidatus Sumerlaeota bacterium]|nr:bacillithiol biosynthesis BshC [Candidatus Sumerlaeota bacterium]
MPFYKPAATDHPGSPLSLEAVAEWKKFLKPYVRDESLLRPLDELVRENATVVVTGQQAGFALGPIYTVIKALDAKLHADAIAA